MDPLAPSSEIVLITGANRGIGLALTHATLSLGYQVVATARDPEKASDLHSLAEHFPGQLRVAALDVDSAPSVAAFISSLAAVDIVVNNAAVFPEEGEETVAEWKMEHLTEAFATNVVGTARLTQALLPLLEKSSRARVVNISSTAGSISGKHSHFYYAYSTSKAALNMLTRAMAFDLQRKNITVVAVHPGWVQTEMGGSDATLTPQESAKALAHLLGTIAPEQAGAFLERDGKPCPYAW